MKHEAPRSLEMGLELFEPRSNFALVSTSGDYAASEALKALRLGLNVMIFSDNVSGDDEIGLKRYAEDHGLLVMGPDCGTAILNGIPLGFANVIERGAIGVVAASGTGLQQVTCLVDRLGGRRNSMARAVMILATRSVGSRCCKASRRSPQTRPPRSSS